MVSANDAVDSHIIQFPANLFQNFPDLLTISEAANLLRVDTSDIEVLIQDRTIQYIPVCNKILVLKLSLLNFLESSYNLRYTDIVSFPDLHPGTMNLDNHIQRSDSVSFSEGGNDMATKYKINQPVTVNGVKHWIRANTMQEFTDKILKLTATPEKSGSHLFSDYAWNWFNTYSLPNIETATATTYRRQLTCHLIPAFEGMAIEDITTDDVQRLFNGMTGVKATKEKAKMVLSQILDSAVEDKLLPQNPLKSKRVKITGGASKSTLPYSVEQMRFLVQHIGDVKDTTDRAYLALQALHPLRLEEVLGLQAADIDIENMQIHVRRAVTHPTRNQPEIKETKTNSSFRTIGLSKLALPYLLDYKSNGPFLFGGSKAFSYTQVRNMCKRIKKDIGFEENITPIRFRTTVLTDLYDQTKDIKLAQAAAGHTTSAMTLKYYVKGRETSSRAVAAVDQAYAG